MWYNHNKRELPWRETSDAYLIWVSEIILQQTQVITGLQYYSRIVNRFPTVQTMANAPEDELLKLWQGMGYYSRARNMYTTAQMIVKNHNGAFPTNYNNIAALKGIGPYTAAAIASIAYNLPHAVVDGNVYRVLARLFAIDTPIDTTSGKKQFHQIASELLDTRQPGLYNQAIMELGALVCKPSSPNCTQCPVQQHCIAYSQQNSFNFPVKSKKLIQKSRFLTFAYIYKDNKTYILKRQGKDIWNGLYQLPVIEHTTQPNDDEIISQVSLTFKFDNDNFNAINISHQKHQLTHQTLYINFVQIQGELTNSNHIQININDLHLYAFPKPIELFLKKQKLG